MDVAVGVSNIVQVPLAIAPAVTGISALLKSIRPEYRLEKWAIRIEQICNAVAAKEDIIPSGAMALFYAILEDYIRGRAAYEEKVKSRKKRLWFLDLASRGHKEHSLLARNVWNSGLTLSMYATMMKQKCSLEHTDRPRNLQGKCLECFPDNFIAARFQSRFPNTESPLTWSFLLKSALNLSNQAGEARREGNQAGAQTVTPPLPRAINLERTTSNHAPPSYRPPSRAETPIVEQNSSGRQEYDIPELSIPLDEEENHFIGEAVRQRLTALGFSCENVVAWESLASQRDMWA